MTAALDEVSETVGKIIALAALGVSTAAAVALVRGEERRAGR